MGRRDDSEDSMTEEDSDSMGSEGFDSDNSEAVYIPPFIHPHHPPPLFSVAFRRRGSQTMVASPRRLVRWVRGFSLFFFFFLAQFMGCQYQHLETAL